MTAGTAVTCSCGQEFASQVTWRRHLKVCAKVEKIDLMAALKGSLQAGKAKPTTNTPALDLVALHQALLDHPDVRTIGPRVFRKQLRWMVAAHLETKDLALVDAAIARLIERGLVLQLHPDLERTLFEVMPF